MLVVVVLVVFSLLQCFIPCKEFYVLWLTVRTFETMSFSFLNERKKRSCQTIRRTILISVIKYVRGANFLK